MSEAYQITLGNQIARPLIRTTGRFLYRTFSKPEVTGLENVPESGAYLIAINHLSIFDPPFVIPFWPVAPTPLGAIELWTERGKAFLTRSYGAIPIDRDRYHRRALESVVATLKAGIPILIAPEGRITRKPGMRRSKLGIAMILEKARVPVVPVGVVGGTPDFLDKVFKLERPEIKMTVGKPFTLPYTQVEHLPRKEAYQKLADYILAHIAPLLPAEYRGYYTDYESYLNLS